MAGYVVMEPPAGTKAETVLVKDGFALFGFLLPPLWLAWNRLWLEAGGAAVLLVALELASRTQWGVLAAPASFFLCLFVGLEGRALRIAALRRRGWREAGAVEAKDLDEAEARFAFGRFAPNVAEAA